MPYKITEFQSTPNPNAVKCILDRPIRDHERGPGSFRTPLAANDDPIAAALFAIPGVTNLLINDNWITVNKEPAADWKSVRAAVTRILAEWPA